MVFLGVAVAGCTSRVVQIQTAAVEGSPLSAQGGVITSAATSAGAASPYVLRTAEEILEQFSRLTGIHKSNGRRTFPAYNEWESGDYRYDPIPNIAAVYASLKSTLPSDSSLAGLSASQYLSVLKLASAFCHRAACDGSCSESPVSNANYDSGRMWCGNLNPAWLPGLTGTATAAFGSDGARDGFARALLNQFWGPAGLADQPDREAAVSALKDYLSETFAARATLLNCYGDSGAPEFSTREIAKSACTMVLASLPVLKF